MRHLPPLDNLVAALEKLPGVGKRSAERMAMAIIQDSTGLARRMADALLAADSSLANCSQCGSLTISSLNPCEICTDPHRANGLLCVVESPGDIIKLEQAKALQGRYHALGGRLSPARGLGISDLRIDTLLGRIEPENIEEVVLALGTDVESDATASYLTELLTSRNVKVSRLAFGLPSGSAIEYADPLTLARAIQGRQTM